MTTRRLLLAAAAALPLALAACDNKCPTQSGRIQTGVSGSCSGASAVQAGQTVTVRLNVCQTCKQTPDSCTVTLPDATAPTTIQLDPLVQACEESTSCPINSDSCGIVNCTFVAPSTPDVYTLLVTGSNGNFEPTLEVVASGGQASCTPPI